MKALPGSWKPVAAILPPPHTSPGNPSPRTTTDARKRGGFQAAKENWLKLCASYPNLSGSDYAVVIALSTYLNSKYGD